MENGDCLCVGDLRLVNLEWRLLLYGHPENGELRMEIVIHWVV